MFYRRVNLVGPQGEKLQAWIAESYADVGTVVTLAEDVKLRKFTVAEAGDQLTLDTQIDPRHAVNVLETPVKEPAKLRQLNGGEPAQKRPRKSKAPSDTVDVQ